MTIIRAFEFKITFYIKDITTYSMSEEIKEDNNCIIKAFENNPISILHEEIDGKKIYCFKA